MTSMLDGFCFLISISMNNLHRLISKRQRGCHLLVGFGRVR